MSRILTSIFMIGSIGYVAFRYRYRLINIVLKSGWLRRFAVSSVMSIPGVKNKMMQTVFGRPSTGGPSDW